MDERAPTYALAAFVAAVGTALVSVGVAKGAAAWWAAGAAILLVSGVIAAQPRWRALRVWREVARGPFADGWQAGRDYTPTEIVLILAGPREAPLSIYMCEFKRRGSTVVYRAYREHQPTSSAVFRFPTDFSAHGSGTPASFDELPHGCYRQDWWSWKPDAHGRKAPVASAMLPIFSPTARGRKARRCSWNSDAPDQSRRLRRLLRWIARLRPRSRAAG